MESTSGLMTLSSCPCSLPSMESLGDLSSKGQNIQPENPISHLSSASASDQSGEEGRVTPVPSGWAG